MKRTALSLILSLILLSGCASVNSVSLTPIPAERNNVVKATKDKIIILGLNFDNDYVDGIVTDLKQQCPNGKVSGILTKDESIMYFLFFVWKRQVTATGYCSKSSAADTRKGQRKTASEEDADAEAGATE